ncbi:MAG: hypothetical protein RRZ73_04015 [Oscillospiraceae bacterium]
MLNNSKKQATIIVSDSINQNKDYFKQELCALLNSGTDKDIALVKAKTQYVNKINEDLSIFFSNSDFRSLNMFGILMTSPENQGFDFDPSCFTAEQLFAITHYILHDDKASDKQMTNIKTLFDDAVSSVISEINS